MKEQKQVVYKESDKKQALESALYYFSNEQPFLGAMLQFVNVKYRNDIPTAAFHYDVKQDSFEIFLNSDFFCSMNLEQRIAILHHEILHFTNKHLFRWSQMNVDPKDRKMWNIAGDMSINQYIKHLPEGGVCVKDWKQKDGRDFPLFESMEVYHELINSTTKPKKKGEEDKPGKGDSINTDQLGKYIPMDEHAWEELSEEEKQAMIDGMKDLIKRTIEKTSFSHSMVPDSIKDLLEELTGMSNKINHKSILKRAIKKTVACADRDTTWKRPNKRFGNYSPGTRLGELPLCKFYFDSSGSISHKEVNMCLEIMKGFLKVGSRNCKIGFWHTSLYYDKKYKMGNKISPETIQSGGTDVKCVMDDIAKTNPNLSLIFTDGYYDKCNTKITGEVIFIITPQGNKDHPMKHVGKTICLDNLK